MDKKITLGDTEFDLENPDHKALLTGLSGDRYAAESYINGLRELKMVFDTKNEIDDSGAIHSTATLNYDKLHPLYIEARFPHRPHIKLDWQELKIHLERFSEGGVDSAERVMCRISEIYKDEI